MKLLTIATTLLLSLSTMAADSIYDHPIQTLAGSDSSLKPYQGKVMLLVNVASECGYTSQYQGLQALHEKHGDKGLAVLGFPCNDFGGQEPADAQGIQTFCSENYGVTFPLFEKISLKGASIHPIFAALTTDTSPAPGAVGWNFEKFLISRDGTLLKRYGSDVEPNDPTLLADITAALEDQ